MSRPLTESSPEIPYAGSSSVAGVPRGTSRHLADEVSAGGDDCDETGEAEERAAQEKPEVEQRNDAADDRAPPGLPLDGPDPAPDGERLRLDDGADQEGARRQIIRGHAPKRGDGPG